VYRPFAVKDLFVADAGHFLYPHRWPIACVLQPTTSRE